MNEKSDPGEIFSLDPERLELPIGLLSMALYAAQRCLAFFMLLGRAGDPGSWESLTLEFFFGKPPYSLLNIIVGYGVPEGILSLLNFKNLLQAVLQTLHFLANWGLLRILLECYVRCRRILWR